MLPFNASAPHPHPYGISSAFTLRVLCIFRSLHLPAVASFLSPSPLLIDDLHIFPEIRPGRSISSHFKITKVAGRFRAVRSFPRRNVPGNGGTPVDPPSSQGEQFSADSNHRPSPSEDCRSRPGFHITEIRASTAYSIHPGSLPRFGRVNTVAKGIKTASGVVKGFKDANGVIRKLRILQKLGPPVGDLFLGFGAASGVVFGLKAAKFVTKSLQLSKGLFTALQARNIISSGEAFLFYKKKLSFLLKGFKAFDGAFTLLHFAIGNTSQRELVKLLNWTSFQSGYKLSKGVVNILDVLLGLKFGIISSVGQGFLLMKKATDGVGVIVKVVFLSKEIYMVVLKGLGLHRTFSNRKLYVPACGTNFHISLTLASPRTSCYDFVEGKSLLTLLLDDSLHVANVNLHSRCGVEVDNSYIFLLAIPLL